MVVMWKEKKNNKSLILQELEGLLLLDNEGGGKDVEMRISESGSGVWWGGGKEDEGSTTQFFPHLTILLVPSDNTL